MALDDAANFAKAIVTSGYDSAATSIAVSAPFSAAASTFPAPPFNAVWWNWTDFPDPSDDPLAEIVRVLAVSANVFPTITRAQEGTSAQAHNTGGKVYKIAAGPTAAFVDDVQSIVNVVSAAVAVVSANHTSLVSDVGRISVALSGTQSDVARISVALSGAISDIAKISTAHVSLVSDVGRISTNAVSLASDVGRISVALSGTASDVARISLALSGAISDIAKISANHVSLVSDVARISVALSGTGSDVARISVALSGTQSDVSRISLALSGAISDIAKISTAHVSLVSDVGRISVALSGAISTLSALNTYVNKAVVSEFDGGLASTASVVIDWANGGAQHFDVSGVPSFANPSNISAGRRYILRLSMGTSAAHSANWATAFVWPSSTPPSLGGSSAVDLLAFYADVSGNLLGSFGGGGGGGDVTSAQFASLASDVGRISVALSGTASDVARISVALSGAISDIAKISADHVSLVSDVGRISLAASAAYTSIMSAVSVESAARAAADTSLDGRATSIMSAVSVESAERAAADISINDRVSAVSTLAAAGLISMGPVRKVLAGAQVITATAPTSVSGFTFAVSAGVAYILEFGFFHSAPVSAAGLKLILSTPTGAVWGDYQIKITPPGGTSTFSIQATNVTLAAVTVSALGVQGITHFRGVYRCSVAGTIGMACGSNTSAGAAGSAITLMAGSFGYVWRQG